MTAKNDASFAHPPKEKFPVDRIPELDDTPSSLARFSSLQHAGPGYLAAHDLSSADSAFLYRYKDKESPPIEFFRLSIDSVGDSWERGEHTQVVPGLARALSLFPQVGKKFLDFTLLGELGSGAFGRVYLAQQGDLANRFVALKITSTGSCESQALAQLQHTNIVPIYSVHQSGPFQAICMPYFGSTTLTDLLRELRSKAHLPATAKELLASATFRAGSTVRSESSSDGGDKAVENLPESDRVFTMPSRVASNAIVEMLAGRTYIEGVVWVLACLADGLAHAHDRGILHRDIKPANILFTDEGQPMLLDFNLSEDLKKADPSTASIGGTLPYMAPEVLRAYLGEPSEAGATADIYSLGIIFFELLTREHPFKLPPHRRTDQMVQEMLEERLQGVPDVVRRNPEVSPALASILAHCLEPDPSRRYQNARQLHEDLYCFMSHQPLRHAKDPSLKERVRRWQRRHPKLVVAITAAVLTFSVFAPAIAYRNHQVKQQQAVENLRAFQEQCVEVQCRLANSVVDREELRQNIDNAQKLLAKYISDEGKRYRIRNNVFLLDDQQQATLRELISGTALMMVQGERLLAESSRDPEERKQGLRRALRLNDVFANCFVQPPRAAVLQKARLLGLLGETEAAKLIAQQAKSMSLQTTGDFALEASILLADRKFPEALALLERGVERNPQHFLTLFLKGLCHKHQSDFVKAEACFSSCVALSPSHPGAYFMRGLTYARHGNLKEASEDLDRAVEASGKADVHLERASVRESMEDYKGAVEDLSRAIKLGAPFVSTCLKRASLKEKMGDILGARRDRQQAINGEPSTASDWLATAWSKRKSSPDTALEELDRALALNPLSRASLHAKAFILSNQLEKPASAIETLDRLIDFFPDDAVALRLRGLLHARSGNRQAALADAEQALARDASASAQYQLAGIYAQTSKIEPEDAEVAFRLLRKALSKGYGKSSISRDVDLNPLRNDTRFQQLVTPMRQSDLRGRS